MRYRDLLTEAPNYHSMLDGLANLCLKHGLDIRVDWVNEQFNNEIKLARQFLKRQDRIVYWLRIYRLGFIWDKYISERMTWGSSTIFSSANGYKAPEKSALLIALENIWADLGRQWEQTMGYPIPMTSDRGQSLDIEINLPTYTHYAAMAEQIPALAEIVWNKQPPRQLIQQMHAIEEAWHRAKSEKLAQGLKQQSGDKTLIEFPDGSRWVRLDRGHCREEGEAMGHCGNAAAHAPGDTILSYRIPAKNGLWKPRLTFILHADGTLGEMKARFNDKPSRELHPQIVALLKLPIIKGITGGGFAASRNFKLSDLDRQTRDELLALKPQLKGRDDDAY